MTKHTIRADSSQMPVVTVAMPIYNAGHYLYEAVMSIVDQTFKDWELLIIDDGSTDNAVRSIYEIQDSRIHILCDGVNKGLAARLNECIDLARGIYFARMDQDDFAYPERLAKQVEALEHNDHLDLVSVRALKVTASDEAVGLYPYLETHAEICARPWVGFYFPHPTWMGRTVWFRRFRYTTPGPFYSEDMDLLLRSYTSSCFGMIPDVLLAYRVRREIFWSKQYKARKAVLGVQWKIFRMRRQWVFAALALMAMLLRVGLDAVRIARQKLRLPEFQVGGRLEQVSLDWTQVRRRSADWKVDK